MYRIYFVEVINKMVSLQVNHLRTFLQFRVTMGFFDSIIAKCKPDFTMQLVEDMHVGLLHQ